MRQKVWILSAVLPLALFAGMAGMARAQLGAPKILKAAVSAPKVAVIGKPFPVVVTLTIAKPYHIQANPPKQGYIATEVKVGPVKGVKVDKLIYPHATRATTAGEVLPVYEGTVQVRAIVTADRTVKPGSLRLPITVHYQGCNDRSCYPPTSETTQATTTLRAASGSHADAGTASAVAAQAQPTSGGNGTVSGSALAVPGFHATEITQFMEPKPFLTWLKQGGSQAGQADTVTSLLERGGLLNLAAALGLIYLLGLALNLTPCVYPLIPITIGYFGRQAAGGARTGALSISYAMGMAVMYSILGIVAALFGKVFGSQLSNPYVLVGFAIVMFALGLTMFDRPDGRPIWELQLPSSLTSQAKSRAGYAGAFLMGLMVGIVAAPCIGPIVVALIELIARTRNVGLGLETFFILGVGLATPYLLLGFGLVKALPRSGEWMIAVKHIFGLLLFGMGLYYLRDLLGHIYMPLMTLYVIGSGIYLLFFDNAGRAAAKFHTFKRALGAAAILAGIWLALPHGQAASATASGAPAAIPFETPADYTALQQKLTQARQENKEVLIDFSASWCAACKELDEKTFHDPDVAKATANYIALRFRLEQQTDADKAYARPFVQTFQIVGLPTVVHLVPAAQNQKTALSLPGQ